MPWAAPPLAAEQGSSRTSSWHRHDVLLSLLMSDPHRPCCLRLSSEVRQATEGGRERGLHIGGPPTSGPSIRIRQEDVRCLSLPWQSPDSLACRPGGPGGPANTDRHSVQDPGSPGVSMPCPAPHLLSSCQHPKPGKGFVTRGLCLSPGCQ